MDISSSEYNSGSESGWTHYLDQSSVSEKHLHWRSSGVVDYGGKGARTMVEEEEEDLSMVSDASSGPPHYHEEDYQGYCVNWYDPSTSQYSKESKTKNKTVKEYGRKNQPSPLDDTASSPVDNCPKKKTSFSGDGAVESCALDYSQCVSASKVKKKSDKFQKHFSFFDSSVGGKQASEEPGDP